MPLADYTTLRLGGPARRLVQAQTEEQIIATVAASDAAGEPVLILAGGSNLVIADAGFDGTALRIGSGGVEIETDRDRVRLVVAAGEPWDRFVERSVEDRLAGIECLAGIPGSAGATPIQNVGAYGQQVSEAIVSVRAYDRTESAVVELTAGECAFAYRNSMFRGGDRFVVLAVTFELERSEFARPVRYGELARSLGVGEGDRPPLGEVRDAVVALRRAKGMVLDPDDPDSVSAGSFFVNPVLSAHEFECLAQRARRHLGPEASPPAWPEADGRVKTSAAWLVERSGFHRGYGDGRVGISSKHTLALVNRGQASTAELLALARQIRAGVACTFGVTLAPEPVLVGAQLV